MEIQKLIETANDMSANDVCTLISVLADRVQIFIPPKEGEPMMTRALDDINPASMNGAVIQINAKEEEA